MTDPDRITTPQRPDAALCPKARETLRVPTEAAK